MHWTPLSGAQFEAVFGPSHEARRNKRSRRPQAAKWGRIQPKIESLEQRETPAIAADVVASSLASTLGSDGMIGEVVRYRVQVDVPSDSSNYQSLDLNAALPPGLTYLNDGTTTIALVSDGGITSSLAQQGSLYISGDESSIDGITPSFVLPYSAIDASGNDVTFASGINRVSDNDGNQEYILIEFNALVNNEGASAADGKAAGDVQTASFQLVVNGASAAFANAAQDVAVAEPSITDLTKSVALSANGKVATYTLTFTNAGATAYNVRILDHVPAGLALNPYSVTVTGGTGYTNNSSEEENILDLNFAAVAAGGRVTIAYAAAVNPAIGAGQVITNVVDLDYDAAPGEPNGADGLVDEASVTFTTITQIPSTGAVTGYVYVDVNNNGVKDAGEAGIPGVRIDLLYVEPDGSEVEYVTSTTTDSNGYWQFVSIDPSTLVIQEQAPPTSFVAADGRVWTVTGDGQDRAGVNPSGITNGVADNDAINFIIMGNLLNTRADNVLFGELGGPPTPPPPPPPPLPGANPRLFASTPGAVINAPSAPTFGSPNPSAGILATGADAGGVPRVRVFDFAAGVEKFNFLAYDASFRGGVRVATGDVNGDGTLDIITAPGAGGGPHVKVFDGVTGQVISQYMAYAPSFTGGVYVAAGDVNGDGKADVITGAGAQGGPHVRVFDGETGRELASFFAFATSFRGGVRVAAGDFNGDGKADIVTAAGPGGGPHVIVYDLSEALNNAAAGLGVLRSFMAFNTNFGGGVYLATGDLNGDGRTDLAIGAGEGGGPHVRVLDGRTFAEIESYMAFNPALAPNGVRVALADINGDGKADIIAGSGAGSGTYVSVFDADVNRELQFFRAYDSTYRSGANVA